MRVVVDFDVCASTGACTQIAPEVFEVRSDGYLYILEEFPEGANAELAHQAADMCPTAAISIEE
jgi:ferredoxin